MPPSPSWYQGRDAIRLFVAATVFADDGMFGGKAMQRWKLVGTRANSAPAFTIYQRAEAGDYQAFGLHVLQYDGDLLSQMVSFIDPLLPSRFALPQKLK